MQNYSSKSTNMFKEWISLSSSFFCMIHVFLFTTRLHQFYTLKKGWGKCNNTNIWTHLHITSSCSRMFLVFLKSTCLRFKKFKIPCRISYQQQLYTDVIYRSVCSAGPLRSHLLGSLERVDVPLANTSASSCVECCAVIISQLAWFPGCLHTEGGPIQENCQYEFDL